MKDSGVNFTLEPIAVCDELPIPSRQVNPEDVICQRKLYDSKIADYVQKINAAPRQQDKYTEPRANSLLRVRLPKSEPDLC